LDKCREVSISVWDWGWNVATICPPNCCLLVRLVGAVENVAYFQASGVVEG